MGYEYVLYGIAILFYGAASAALVGYVYFKRWGQWARVLTWAAWSLHTVALLLRVVETGRPPLLYLFETVSFFTWLVMLNYLVLELVLGLQVVGVFVVPVTALLLLTAGTLPRGALAAAPWLHGSWVMAHVSLGVLSYGGFALAFIAGVMYLIQDWQLRRKEFRPMYYRMPPLEVLDSMGYYLILFGFPLLTLALLSGSLGAIPVWGGAWGTDPKVIWSLFTWVIYALYLYLRLVRGWGGRRAAVLAVVGFGAVLFNFFVINLYMTELHRYVNL